MESQFKRLSLFSVVACFVVFVHKSSAEDLSCNVVNVNIDINPVVFSTESEIDSFRLTRGIIQGITKEKNLQQRLLESFHSGKEGEFEKLTEELTRTAKADEKKKDELEGTSEFKSPLERLNLHAKHLAYLHCSGVEGKSSRIEKLRKVLGPGHRITPKDFGTLQEKSPRPTKYHFYTTYVIQWNVTNFKSSIVDVNSLLNNTMAYKHLPIYMYLIGGSKVKDIKVNMFYVYDYLLFKEGNDLDKIHLWYNITKWQYRLQAPSLEPRLHGVAYRLTVADHAGNKYCENTVPAGSSNSLQIICQNHQEDAVRIGQSTRVYLYTLGDKSDVPTEVFNSLLSYSRLCEADMNFSRRVACGLITYIDTILLVYFAIVMMMQMQTVMYPNNHSLRNKVEFFGVLAYLVLYCPVLIMNNDFKQLRAALYIFYLDGFKQSALTHGALSVAWVLYPGLVTAAGLIPAILYLSDVVKYGHFHSCFIPRNCVKSEDGVYECQLGYNSNVEASEKRLMDSEAAGEPDGASDKKRLMAETTVYGVPCDQESTRRVPKPRLRRRVALSAVGDVLKLFHWAILLYCLPWLAYYIFVGVYPSKPGVQILLCFAGIHVLFYMFSVVRNRASARKY